MLRRRFVALRALRHHDAAAPELLPENVLRLRGMGVSTSEWSRLSRLVVALLASVLVLMASPGGSAGTPRFDDCIGVGCGGDDVTLSTASEVPGRASGSTPACLHDAGCGGAHSGGTAGLTLAAVPAGIAALVAARPQGPAQRAAAALRSLLFGRQLYRPPRFA